MIECENCKKVFTFPSRLERHMNKKFSCKKPVQNCIIEDQNYSTKNQNYMHENQKCMPENQNCIPENQNCIPVESRESKGTKCQFCDKECKNHVKRHESSCPVGKDEVRLLEIELGIPYKKPDKLTCKFCNKKYSRTNLLAQHDQTCLKKQIYLATLEGKRIAKETGMPVNVNVNITNNIANNNSINNNDNRSINNNDNRSVNTIQNNVNALRKFGDEDTSYISKGTIYNAMKKGLDVGFSRIISEIHCNDSHPENHNLRLTNIRSAVMDVFNGHEFEKQPVDEVIAKVLKKTTDLMFEHYFDNENYYDSNPFVRSSFNNLDSLDNNDPKDMKPFKQKAKCRLYNNSNKMKISN